MVALTERFNNMYAAVGFHPHYAKDVSADDLAMLKKETMNDKVVAVGETGLDYHYNFSKQDVQKEVFRSQLRIASEVKLPVIVHLRNAFEDGLAIMDEFSGKLKRVVVHCFSGPVAQAEQVLERGYYISFTGIVTFKKAHETVEAAKAVGLERLMVETDCPYISPEPVRNQRPCEPALMVHTARKLAEIKGMDLETFAEAVTATSKQFFDLP